MTQFLKKSTKSIFLSLVILGGASLFSGCSSDKATPADLSGTWTINNRQIAISYQFDQNIYNDNQEAADAAVVKLKDFVVDLQKNLGKLKSINIVPPSKVSLTYDDDVTISGIITINNVSESYKTFKITSAYFDYTIEGEANASSMIIYYPKTAMMPMLKDHLTTDEYTFYDSLFQAIVGLVQYSKAI